MAGQTPNSLNIYLTQRVLPNATPLAITHPEYQYHHWDWLKIRDCLLGQRQIKLRGEQYLKKLQGSDRSDYAEYLEGAVFFNMTAQTLQGMTGQVFRRDPAVRNVPDRLKQQLGRFGKDGADHVTFTKTVLAEQCAIGRYGVLVDAPLENANSYAVGYAAENILDWTVQEVDNELKLTRVLLREYVREQAVPAPTSAPTGRGKRNTPPPPANPYVWPYHFASVFRELLLEQQEDGTWAYLQRFYKNTPTGAPLYEVAPLINGNMLDFIPFVFFGATGNQADTEKSPLLDIAELNLSHYRTYADLEHGRRYTALPVYWTQAKVGQDVSEYHIGPKQVWEVPEGCTPGILEYQGTGLKALETALATKEAQIAAIGGRLLPGQGKGVSMSEGQAANRENAEQSILLNVIVACMRGMTQVLRFWAMWRDVTIKQSANYQYVINTDFLASSIGAREMRAIQLLYEAGFITIDILYDYLRRAEVIGDDVTLDDFTGRLNDPEAFINNPDAHAKQRGFESRKQELDEEARAVEQHFQDRELDLQQQQLDLEAGVAEAAQQVQTAQMAVQTAQAQLSTAQAKHQQLQTKLTAKQGVAPSAAGATSVPVPKLKPLRTPQTPQPSLTPNVPRNLKPGAPAKDPKAGF